MARHRPPVKIRAELGLAWRIEGQSVMVDEDENACFWG